MAAYNPSSRPCPCQVTYGEGAGLFLSQHAIVQLEGTTFTDNKAIKGADVSAGPLVKLAFLAGNNIGNGSQTVWWPRTACLIGEVLQDGGYCARCGTNLYSVLPNATACQLCPAHAACPGGDVIEPLRGHWHSQAYSALIHQCPNAAACSCAPSPDKPGACVASPCAEGYAGNACGACAPGFAATGPLKCGMCLGTALLVFLYALSIALVLALMAYSAAATWADNLEFASLPSNSQPPPRPGDVLAVLILFLQYLGIVAAVPVPWPASFRGALASVTWLFASISGGGALSLDCLLGARTRGLPLAVARIIIQLLAQLCMVLLVMAAFALPWGRLRLCVPRLLGGGARTRAVAGGRGLTIDVDGVSSNGYGVARREAALDLGSAAGACSRGILLWRKVGGVWGSSTCGTAWEYRHGG
jgi:hypothetical protein